MTARRPIVLGAALALLLVMLAGCGSSSGPSRASTTSHPSRLASDHDNGTSTPGHGDATTIPSDAGVLTPQDGVLRAPAAPETLTLGGADPCQLLLSSYPSDRCGELTADFAQHLVWLVSGVHATGPTMIEIFRQALGELTETLALPAAVAPSEMPAVVEVADLDHLEGDELVVGFRSTGTAGFLQIEIIGAAGTEVAHDTVDLGRAEVKPGVIDLWSAQFGPDDPNCCPSSFQHQQIVFDGGNWRLLSGSILSAHDTPAGQFP